MTVPWGPNIDDVKAFFAALAPSSFGDSVTTTKEKTKDLTSLINALNTSVEVKNRVGLSSALLSCFYEDGTITPMLGWLLDEMAALGSGLTEAKESWFEDAIKGIKNLSLECQSESLIEEGTFFGDPDSEGSTASNPQSLPYQASGESQNLLVTDQVRLFTDSDGIQWMYAPQAEGGYITDICDAGSTTWESSAQRFAGCVLLKVKDENRAVFGEEYPGLILQYGYLWTVAENKLQKYKGQAWQDIVTADALWKEMINLFIPAWNPGPITQKDLNQINKNFGAALANKGLEKIDHHLRASLATALHRRLFADGSASEVESYLMNLSVPPAGKKATGTASTGKGQATSETNLPDFLNPDSDLEITVRFHTRFFAEEGKYSLKSVIQAGNQLVKAGAPIRDAFLKCVEEYETGKISKAIVECDNGSIALKMSLSAGEWLLEIIQPSISLDDIKKTNTEILGNLRQGPTVEYTWLGKNLLVYQLNSDDNKVPRLLAEAYSALTGTRRPTGRFTARRQPKPGLRGYAASDTLISATGDATDEALKAIAELGFKPDHEGPSTATGAAAPYQNRDVTVRVRYGKNAKHTSTTTVPLDRLLPWNSNLASLSPGKGAKVTPLDKVVEGTLKNTDGTLSAQLTVDWDHLRAQTIRAWKEAAQPDGFTYILLGNNQPDLVFPDAVSDNLKTILQILLPDLRTGNIKRKDRDGPGGTGPGALINDPAHLQDVRNGLKKLGLTGWTAFTRETKTLPPGSTTTSPSPIAPKTPIRDHSETPAPKNPVDRKHQPPEQGNARIAGRDGELKNVHLSIFSVESEINFSLNDMWRKLIKAGLILDVTAADITKAMAGFVQQCYEENAQSFGKNLRLVRSGNDFIMKLSPRLLPNPQDEWRSAGTDKVTFWVIGGKLRLKNQKETFPERSFLEDGWGNATAQRGILGRITIAPSQLIYAPPTDREEAIRAWGEFLGTKRGLKWNG